jgi:predicted dehydrogenase
MAIRAGLIGYGLGGAAFHAPLIATTPGLTLEAIVTTNPERRAQAERAYPGVRLLSSADELFTTPRPVDLVVVTTPNRSHIPLAMSALRAGLPVVIDKPIAPTSAAARDAIAEAARRGLMLTVFHNRRWDGDFLTLRRLLAEGALGDVHRFESRYERWRPTGPAELARAGRSGRRRWPVVRPRQPPDRSGARALRPRRVDLRGDRSPAAGHGRGR